VLFGAGAGAEALPFPRRAYGDTVRTAGVGVEASLRAFAQGFEQARSDEAATPPVQRDGKRVPALRPVGHLAYDALVAHARAAFPPATHSMIAAGLQRVIDFQDVAYGKEYLDLLTDVRALDQSADGAARDFNLTRTTAKYLAVAMAYDDVYRVADLKTRASRFARVRAEIGATSNQLVYTTEFMHPRMDEVAGSLPAWLGRFIERRPHLFKRLDRIVNRGRRVRTSTVGSFVALYVLGGLKRFRRGTLRHAIETAHRNAWLARVKAAAPADYALAVELLANRRLIKGYSDTHTRGESKFDRVMAAAARLQGRADAADWVRRLREAALKDEDGIALSGALKTIDSFL
jgi:indolepyruvate ferredoxin oxidoreductase beta subunit